MSMEQELKQRLIGAAVITALAAIFVPMLFDDPIDESGKSVNELRIPDLPNKAQDVEIMPLPEKAEDVATVTPIEKPELPAAGGVYESEEEVETGRATQTRPTISEHDTPVKAQVRLPEPEIEAAEEDVEPPPAVVKATAKAVAPTETPTPAKPVAETVRKPSQAAIENATVRWYLNVGSFGRKDNAVNMMENLRKQGFSVSIKAITSDKGPVYKVRVGPMLDKVKAQEVKDKLSKININSFVSGED
ncbi:MAG: SPOR domain-containing protein [Gammaproteobacteria bacterium]